MLPALSPMMVTLPGSPPKARTLRWIHCSAKIWSRRPWLPGFDSSSRVKKPRGPSLKSNQPFESFQIKGVKSEGSYYSQIAFYFCAH